MKKSFLSCAFAAIVMCMSSCSKNNDLKINNIIDAACNMYGKSIDNAISTAKSQGLTYVVTAEGTTICYDSDPQTTTPSKLISLNGSSSNVQNVSYVIKYDGNQIASKSAEFLNMIGKKRSINGKQYSFWEGTTRGESGGMFTDFTSFVDATGAAESWDASWETESQEDLTVKAFGEFEANANVSYIQFIIGNDE